MQIMNRASMALVAAMALTACQNDTTAPFAEDGPMMAPRASITFDAILGTGFVGKGDVQYTFGRNNPARQANAANVGFRVSSIEVTEYSWTCDRDAGPQTQERARTATTTYQGLIASIARERNQITGFILSGYNGTPTTSTETSGPPLWSCANFWTATNMTTNTLQASANGMEVTGDAGATWTALLEKPVIIP